jgi:3-deoxy-D-arabino-heptulosonate 7-phosphate (DAHP) synthase
VESEEQTIRTAQKVKEAGAHMLTSRGLGSKG